MRSCDICGGRFRVDKKESWKGRCGECAPVMRDAMVTCPGCNRRYQFARMELVSVQVQPGKAGGKKFKIRYCQVCLGKVRARSSKLEEGQEAEFKRAADAQREFMRDIRGR